MKHEKAREVRMWIKEQGVPLYFLLILISFLIIKCFLDLNENLQHFYGDIGVDFLPNKIAFFLLVLWLFQATIFYKRTMKMTSSGRFLTLLAFIVVAYFLAAYVWIWIDMFRSFFSGYNSLRIPTLNDYDIFLHWVGDEVWRLNFPWGGIVFPLLVFLFYAVFVICFVLYMDMENKAFLILSSLLCFGVTLLLISSLMEALTIMKEGVGQQKMSTYDAFGRFLVEQFHMKPALE